MRRIRWDKSKIHKWLADEGIHVALADEEFIGTKHKHNWTCIFGHTFPSSLDGLKQKLKESRFPCPQCKPSQKREEWVRFAFEQITCQNFPKQRPEWLVDDVTTNRLELDGYCENLALAFEYDGEQHTTHKPIFHTHEEFLDQQRRDALKDKLCKERGIALIRRKFDHDIKDSIDELVNSIRSARPQAVKQDFVDWKKFNSRIDFDLVREANDYAAGRSGECRTSEIYDVNSKIKFYCPKHDHEWELSLRLIRARPTWCNHCGYEQGAQKNKIVFDEQELIELGQQFDPPIKLLLWAGTNEHDEYLWECSSETCEFPFKMSLNDVRLRAREGLKPCPICNKKRRIQLWEMHRYAETKGGECISTAIGPDKKVKFSCHNFEHPAFELAVSQVKNDEMWCECCRDKVNKRISQKEVADLCEKHQFRLLSTYLNNTQDLDIECRKCGHKEKMNLRTMRRRNGESWCYYCAK